MSKFQGLTTAQVKESYEKYKRDNTLSEKEAESFLSIFLNAFKDPWVIVLVAALFIRIILNVINPHESEWYEVYGLMAAIALTTGVSSYTEYKNNKNYEALKASQESNIPVAVFRDGELIETSINNLVIGDYVKLRSGDQIPADGFIVEGNLSVDQASLNGESEPAKKIAFDGEELETKDDTFNEYLLLRGSNVLEGEAVMKVTEVGDFTMIGSINTSLQEENKKSPSEEKLDVLAKQIGVMGFSAAGAYIVISLISSFLAGLANVVFGFDEAMLDWWLKHIMYSVSIIIMAVPEGLPMMNAMVASMNSNRLLQQNILVRNSKSIETAGYTEILFSDKTGTITKGKMEVVELLNGDGETFNVKEKNFNNLSKDFIKHLQYGIGLNNDSFVHEGHGTGSNPTDNALMTFLYNKDLHEVDKDLIVSKELFDSAKKYASVSLKDNITYIKGAPEFTMSNIKYYLDSEGNKQEFTNEVRDKFTEASNNQANRSMRVLAVISKENDEETLITGVCLRDDLREGMKDTIAKATKAGVQVVMVTGDRKETAVAIAKEAGILTKEEHVVLTHDELEKLSDDEVKALIPNLRVVARALPMDKKRLVNLSQELKKTVAMTGDGVNDSASLKTADVGFALGDGTQVAQGASDIVLLNNSLNSIITAIKYGRTMTKSVQKFIIFQLTVNVTTIALALIGSLINVHEVFSIIQILWINLIMDTLAALAFGMEPALERYLDVKPIPRTAKILTNYMKSAIGTASLYITVIATLILMGITQPLSNTAEPYVRTFMFAFFIYSIIFNSLNTRSETFNLLEHITENKRFIWVMGSIAIVQTLIIQFGGLVFGTVQLTAIDYLFALALAFLIIPIDLFKKSIFKIK